MKTQKYILFAFLSLTIFIFSSCTKSGDSTVANNFLVPRGPASDNQLVLKELLFDTQEDTELFSLLTDQLASNLSSGGVSAQTAEYTIIDQPKYGVATLDKNGQLSYIPMNNYIGVDSFKYEVKINNKVYENTVKIRVWDVNDRPILMNESFTIEEDSILTSTLSSMDVDSLLLTYQLVQSTSHGFISLLPSGQINYIPNLNFNGVDSFKVKVNDGHDDSDVVTYTITVML